MKAVFTVFFVLLCGIAHAQVVLFDDFEDGSITNTANSSSVPANLTWSGNTGKFSVVSSVVLAGAYSLRSSTGNGPGAINEPYPSGMSLGANNITWRLVYRNNTALTPDNVDVPAANNNSWRLWLAASSTARASCFGYFLTHKGSQLVLRAVSSQANNAYNDILSFNISNQTTYSIRITRRASDGLWKMFVTTGTGEALAPSVGSGYHSSVTLPAQIYTLFDANNTTANANSFFWDNYQVSQSYLQADCNDNSVQTNDIYAGETNKAIFSFRLTATDDIPLKFIYIASSYTGLNDGKIKNNTARLVQSDDNDFNTAADNVDISAQFSQIQVDNNSIKFGNFNEDGFLIPGGSSKYYFVVIDVNNPFTGSGTPPPTTFSSSSTNSTYNATAGTFQFAANNKVQTNDYDCSKTQTFVAICDWTGGNSNANNWNDNANWNPNRVPGQYDMARIGSNVTFTNAPKIQNNSNYRVKNLVFGSVKNASLSIDANSSLTVTDCDVVHSSSPSGGAEYYSDVSGDGTLTIDNLRIGNDQAPPNTFTSIAKSIFRTRIKNLTVNNNITLKSVGNANSNGLNWGQFTGANGTILLNGQIETIKVNNYNNSNTDAFASSIGKFEFGSSASGDQPTLILTNSNAILPITFGFGIDFSFPDDESVRQSTVIYRNNSTSAQTVYPSGNLIIGRIPANYRNVVFEGSGPKRSAGMNERTQSGASS
ncbi:MAG: hypothetical protein INR69_13595, partial [Mucilaginibacter polytrichastri]|nr:hypothetical protein [Mucilaginibacter polytrichastri]